MCQTRSFIPRKLELDETWREFLQSFADSSGLLCVLVPAESRELKIFASSAYAKLLASMDIWREETAGYSLVQEVIYRATVSSENLLIEEYESMSIACFNLRDQTGKLEFSLVLGFIPDHFLDPIETHRLARFLGCDGDYFSRQLKNQPPIGKKAFRARSEFFYYACKSCFDSQQARFRQEGITQELEIIANGMLEIDTCTSLPQISETVSRTVRQLAPGVTTTIRLYPHEEEQPPRWLNVVPETATAKVMTIPVFGSNKGKVADVYLSCSGEDDRPVDLTALNMLFMNLGVALERLSLIDELERNRQELNSLNLKLMAQDQAKDQFIMTLGHDIRSPLNTVLGWIEIFPQLDKEQQKEALNAMQRGAETQLRLIEDLLDVSKMKSGKFQIDKTPVDIVEIVRTKVEDLKAVAGQKGIRLTFESSVKSLIIRADSNRVQQVLTNLVENSLKFTPAGGHVSVEMETLSNELKLSVKDTGRGLTPEEISCLFTKFFQRDHKNGGLGLGLTIVRTIVERHGGRVEVASDGPKKGSRFTVYWPAIFAGL